MNKSFYTQAQVESVAKLAAEKAVSAFLNLNNGINCINSEKGMDMEERRRVVIGYNDDGTPITKMLRAKSQEEMNEKIVQAYLESGRISEVGELNQRRSVLLSVYSEEWMQRKRKLKQTTVVNYRKYLNEYILPLLGNKYVHQITSLDVQKMLDIYGSLAHSTLKNMKEILSQIMKYAINDGIIDKNPCADLDIEIPSDRKKVREALVLEDFKDILANFGKLGIVDQRFLGLCMYTAMRRGEILGLQWEDICDGEIRVCRNVTHPQQNSPVVTTPKTEAGVRKIPMVKELEAVLRHQGETGYILGGEKPFTLSAYRNMWERINKTIDMHGATPHVLRHSYLTYAVGETTDYKTVQGISGHADVGTLLNIYAHPQEEKMKRLTNRMAEILRIDDEECS